MPTAVLAILLALGAIGGWPGGASADDRPTLRVDPATQNVAPGQQFVVNVVQSAALATTGAQVNVTFDPKFVQMKDFELGPAYTSASAIFAFGNADFGTNATKALAMDRANKFGTLENAAGFLLPGSGTIPAGDTVFLKITFVARSGPGGKMNLGLGKGSMIGETGNPLDPHLVIGALIFGAGGAPGASGSPGPSGEPSPSFSAVGQALPSSPTVPVKVSVAPTSITLQAGLPARVFLVANAAGNLSSVAADLTFDKDKLEITGIEAGSAWSAATVIAVASGTSRGLAGAIAEANTTGVLQQAGVVLPPRSPDLPSGEAVFVSILVKAKADGTSDLSLGNAAALGVSGETIPVMVDAGSFTKPPAKGVGLDPTLVIPLVLLAILIVVGVLAARSGRIPVRVRRRWPFYASLLLGLIPVALFVGMVLMLVINSAPVVTDPGIGALFGSDFGLYGLLPALWGSILITVIAVLIALPISLTLAIVAVDFPMGVIGRLVRPAVGILSGIPPIVYAVSVPFWITLLMIPKFAANANFSSFSPAAIGANPATWPPPDVPYSAGGFPWDLTGVQNSTLLGGILIALFLIPFVTPLFVDALRDVPRAAREASLALGANRTYTLRRVVLPRALPAIAGASMFGVLKALGDTLIIWYAVGFDAPKIPNPPIDVLERTSSLAAEGAGMILSVETLGTNCKPTACAVGYSTALALLVFAAVVVLVMTSLQARGRRRLAV